MKKIIIANAVKIFATIFINAPSKHLKTESRLGLTFHYLTIVQIIINEAAAVVDYDRNKLVAEVVLCAEAVEEVVAVASFQQTLLRLK